VGWKTVQRDGKASKVPFQPDGSRRASVTDPAHWGRLESVDQDAVEGVGFVFTAGDPYLGIDLDGCRENGRLTTWGLAILEGLRSYAEASPSGTGVHILLKGRLEEGHRWGAIEVYDRGRYFTTTGRKIRGTPGQVLRRQSALDAILPVLRVLGRTLGRLPQDVKWHDLAAGRWEEHYSNQSDADFAFLARAAEFALEEKDLDSEGRAALIERVFGWTGLVREKWERADYRDRTIGEALKRAEKAPAPTESGGRGRDYAGVLEYQRWLRAARKELDVEEADAAFEEPPSVFDSGAEWMALNLPSTSWRARGLMAEGDNVLLASIFKGGKTVTGINLLRSLCDGTAFMGHFEVTPPEGRIVYWNLEVGERRFQDWVRSIGIEQQDRFSVAHWRGYNPDLRSPAFRVWAARRLKQQKAQVWIIDPLARLFRGDENSNTEVRDFLDQLDSVKTDAGIGELVLIHHFGRIQEQGEEHGRGATRLDDWPDARWILTREKGDGHTRYFYADGRDVDVEEAPLGYDERTRRIAYRAGEGGRSQTTVQERRMERAERSLETDERVIHDLCERLLAHNHAVSWAELINTARGTKKDRSRRAGQAVAWGAIVKDGGLYTLSKYGKRWAEAGFTAGRLRTRLPTVPAQPGT